MGELEDVVREVDVEKGEEIWNWRKLFFEMGVNLFHYLQPPGIYTSDVKVKLLKGMDVAK